MLDLHSSLQHVLRQMLQCLQQTVHLHLVVDIVGNLSITNFWKPSGVGFGCVAYNVFNVFLVLYVWDTNNDINPELEKSQTLSVHDICRAHQLQKMLVTVCRRLECKCTITISRMGLRYEWD